MARHTVSQKTYLLIFGGLIALTALTVFTATRLNLGVLNAPIALLIAATKAALVLLFFMHVLYSTRLTWVVALSGLAWLAILIALTFSDYVTRQTLPVPGY
jgi:cytochrome c oxidase subunit 4